MVLRWQRNREKIPWEGEFSLRSDLWAGLSKEKERDKTNDEPYNENYARWRLSLVIRFRNGIKPRTADRRLCVFSFISHGICLYFFMKMLNLSKKRSFLQRINLLLSLSFIFIWFLVLHFHLLLGLLLSSIGSGITFLSFAMFSHHLFQILIFICFLYLFFQGFFLYSLNNCWSIVLTGLWLDLSHLH